MVKNKITAKKVALLGVFAATAVALSAAENMIPPLPFMPPGAKLGLSNIITMFLSMNGMLSPSVFISLAKGAFSLMTRGTTAGVMSAAGGILSSAVIFLLAKTDIFGYLGLGVSGAGSHNIAQLCVSFFIIGPSVQYYLPALILFAVISGTLTSLVLKYISPYAKRFLGGKSHDKYNKSA